MKFAYHFLRLVVLLFALFFLVGGLQWLFSPANLASDFGLLANGILGWATIRADLGALFLVTGICATLAASHHPQANAFLTCGCLLMGTAACGRLIGFVMDGIPQDGITPLIFELAVIASLVGLATTRMRLQQRGQV